jgi:hypothetical protein
MVRRWLRWVFVIHRYLGIGIGLLMVTWCLSGFVMMYVPYPQLTESERVLHLAPIDWQRCCVIDPAAVATSAPISRFQLEALDGQPTLRIRFANGSSELLDLGQGNVLDEVGAIRTATVAARYGALGSATPPRLIETLAFDQWTVQGARQPNRPLHRFSLQDAQGTEIYVSSRDGSAVQITTRWVRFWNWLGSVPHWIYFPALRSQPAAWTQTVVWTSTVGCFLTLTGLFAGIVQLRKGANGRWVPYRGFHYWHHVSGLVFGILVLTWIASGLISMNPWGFLEGGGYDEPARIQGTAPDLPTVVDSIRALPKAALGKDIVSIESAPLNGRLYWVATRVDGQRMRLDTNGLARPLERSDLNFIVSALDPTPADYRLERIDTEDVYYFSHHREQAQLPAYRVVSESPSGNCYYLDVVSGQILAKLDADGRTYRWLHQAFHRLDFSATVRSHPLWDILMLTLLSGVTVTCGLGTYLGIRSLIR